MARSLQVLSILSRLAALSASPSLSANSCRFASKGASRAWTAQTHGDRDRRSNRPRYSEETAEEDMDLEDVEDRLQALVDEELKRQKTVKYHILRRKMTPSGPPQRKLTWDAMEQIRYLKQEHPEEWTVERLAEGFSVTPDVILRVLRSKFVTSPERRAKQNANVTARLSQQVLPSGAGTQQDRLKLAGSRTPAILPSGSTEGALVPAANQTQVIQGKGSGSLVRSPALGTTVPAQFKTGFSKEATVTTSTEDSRTVGTNPTDEEDEESWDGQVLTEKELEEIMEMKKRSPLSPAVKVGNEFFDVEGNFLYRI